MAFLSKSKADEIQKNTQPTRTRRMGQLYPEIFNSDGNIKFKKNMALDVLIVMKGRYIINSNAFPKEKCPVCGTKTLIPYSVRASMLSGCHIIKFYCLKCHDRYANNCMTEYYNQIYHYIVNMNASH